MKSSILAWLYYERKYSLQMIEGEKVIPINIEDEMKSAYIDYSMSVIVSRALPDVRDGLKTCTSQGFVWNA